MGAHHWNMEMNHLLVKIERETEHSIKRLRKSLHQCGLSFDQKFRRFFLRATDNRLSETFDRFEIDNLEEYRQSNGHHDRRHQSQSQRDRSRRSASRSYSHSHHHNYNRSRSYSRHRHHRSNSRERSSLRHERSRSRGAHVSQSRPSVRKSSVKDRLGTPVKKPSKQPLSPKPSTSKQQPEEQQPHHQHHHHGGNDEPDSKANGSQALDDIDDAAASHETFDMSDLDSILSKCISKPSQIATSAHLLFACIYCQNDENFPNACSHDIDDVYAHWLSGHTDLTAPIHPFGFAVRDHNSACFYCDDKIGTLQQMLRHQKECHRNRSIAIVNPANRTECAFCNYSDSTWLDHFVLDHKMLLEHDSVNPISLTDALLMELLAIDIQKPRQCALCSETFPTQHQFDDHSARVHPVELENAARIVVASSSKMHLICDVCQGHIEPNAFLNHLVEHDYQFTCTKCDFFTDDLVNLAFHDNQMHQCFSLNFHCLQFSDRLQRHFFHTKAVFGNGLTLTKHNLLNTTFNDYNEFRYMIETMIDIKVKKFKWLMRAHQLRHTGNDLELMSDADHANADYDDDHDNDDDMCSVSTNEFLLSTMASSHNHGQLSPPQPSSATFDRKAHDAKCLPNSHQSSSYVRELRKQLRLLKNICIHGIPRRENENLREIVLRVFARLGGEIASNDINAVHRISKSDPLIIVKFQKLSAKQRVMVARRNKVVLTHDVIDIPDDVMPSKVHIFAQLTNYFEEMRKMAKQYMKHRRLIAYSLTQHGFMVKRKNGSPDKLVCSRDELRSYAMSSKD